MIAVLLADGFEEVEALTPVDMLRRAGFDVKTVGINGKIIAGAHKIPIICDVEPKEVELDEVSLVIFPGGMPGALNLDAAPFTDKIISAVTKNGGRIAAICAAPLILGRRGLLDGRRATCYPGFEDELKGATVVDKDVVTDGNITTARGMTVALDFAKELVAILTGQKKDIPEADENEEDELISLDSLFSKLQGIDESEWEDFDLDEEENGDSGCKEETIEDIMRSVSIQSPSYDNYQFPPAQLLKKACAEDAEDEEKDEYAEKIINAFKQFNVRISIKSVERGPRITRYEIVPERGVKVRTVTELFNDLALSLGVEGMRMEAPVPGKTAISLEIPNKKAKSVCLGSLIEEKEFVTSDSNTLVCLGKDVVGESVYADISKMPHVLIAGATGMGKSVCINSIITSILYKAKPDEVKFILMDPKKVEFNAYNGIPHLLLPVINDVRQAAGALMWAVEQMEKRYDLMEALEVRKLDSYNDKVRKNPELGSPLPKIIIVIDELNDIMLQAKRPAEDLIMSIAQKARAVGIHLVIGTQRPSVDVITGVIKANIPSRISCKVASYNDSKNILDQAGAEKLLNNGDMLYISAGAPKPLRMQGAFVSDSEISAIIGFLKAQAKENVYDPRVIEQINLTAQNCSLKAADINEYEDESIFDDEQFIEAVELALHTQKISTSFLQRKLLIGYSKAAKYIDHMEELGIVSEPSGQKPRDVLITEDDWEKMLSDN